MKRMLILLLMAVFVCVAAAAAAEEDTLTFDKTVKTVNEGATLQTVLIREGDPAGGEITYSSSEPRVAEVDGNGLVTGLKKGETTITAIVKTEKKSYRAAIKLTVVRPVTSVTVKTEKLPVYDPADPKVAPLLTAREDPEENALPVLLLSVKNQLELTVIAEPKDASDRKTRMTSSNEEIFRAKGTTLTGVAPGEGILTVASASDPQVTARFRVLVIQPVTRLTIQASAPSLAVGGQVTVTAAAEPGSSGSPAPAVTRSALENATTHGMPCSAKSESSWRSASHEPRTPSTTSTATSQVASTLRVASTRSSPNAPSSSKPGVSTMTTGPSGKSSIALRTGSVVVPATSETTASCWPVTAFTRLDLPALRTPKNAICTRSPLGVSLSPMTSSFRDPRQGMLPWWGFASR